MMIIKKDQAGEIVGSYYKGISGKEKVTMDMLIHCICMAMTMDYHLAFNVLNVRGRAVKNILIEIRFGNIFFRRRLIATEPDILPGFFLEFLSDCYEHEMTLI